MRADPDGPGLDGERVRTRTPAQDPVIRSELFGPYTGRIALDRRVSVELYAAVDTEPFVRADSLSGRSNS